MEGMMAVTVRMASGHVESMARWTNSLAYFVHNVRFIEGQLDYIDDYMKQWTEMKRDWDQHSLTKDFVYPMTPIYAPWRWKAPTGYGMIVFDFLRQHILTMQNHINFGFIAPAELQQLDRETEYDYCELIRQERLHLVKRFYRKGVSVRTGIISSLFEIKDLVDADDSFSDIFIDLQPWQVHRYPETLQGALDIRDQMMELGFFFTEKEDQEWHAWIDNHKMSASA